MDKQGGSSEFYGGEVSAYELSVLRMRRQDECREIVRQEFLDEDVDAAASRFARSAVFAEIVAMLEEARIAPGARVLDLGGGRGLLARALQEQGFSATTLEISFSDVCGLGALRGRPRSFAAVCGNGEQMPVASESFDLVVCKQVLHHTQDMVKLLTEVRRALRPGGTAIAHKEHCLPWYGGKRTFLKRHPGARFGAQENAFRATVYTRAFRRSGFINVRVEDLLSAGQLRREYLAHPWKRRLIGVPGIGTVLFKLAYLKYYVWRYWCCSPGQTMSFIAEKPRDS